MHSPGALWQWNAVEPMPSVYVCGGRELSSGSLIDAIAAQMFEWMECC